MSDPPRPPLLRGQRTVGGTVHIDALRRVNSEEELPSAPPKSPRSRANTAPELQAPTEPIQAVAALEEPEEDEELRMAKAMALAIENNPHMTIDEIRQLVGAPTSVAGASSTAQAPPSLFAPHNFKLPAFDLTGLAAMDPKKTGFKQFGEALRGKFVVDTSATPRATGGAPSALSSSSATSAGAARRNPLFRKPSPRSPPTVPSIPSVNSEQSSDDLRSSFRSSLAAPRSDPIRLTGLAWKRRGGMGKYSTTSAWELRRIELAGTRLLYYSNEAADDDDTPQRVSPRDQVSLLLPELEEGVVVAKRANWLEAAAASWNPVSSLDPTTPRGYLDLAKEKATVHAAFGHSGAPSPFAISIKVKNETKWKLCFDYHSTMMEWLAAMTDIVVQTSLDTYNASLLAAADPANQMDPNLPGAMLFEAPQVKQPPGTDKNAKRLWTMDAYAIESGDKVPVMESDDDESKFEESAIGEDASHAAFEEDAEVAAVTAASSSSSSSPTNEPPRLVSMATGQVDHSSVRAAAQDAANKTLRLPEQYLWHAALVVNLALFVARSSSTSMQGFWYLVVFTNVGLFFCLVKEPEWQDILEHVRAMPESLPQRPANLVIKAISGRKVAAAKKQKMVDAVPRPAAAKVPGYKPLAGSTTVRLKNSTDAPVNAKNEVFGGWCQQPGSIMQVRSHGYSVTKAKVESPGELYECVHVDIFESPERYPEMAKRVRLPACEFKDGDQPKTWRMPDIFIVSIALPTDQPKFGRSSSDGGGYTVTCYFRMHADVREILRRVTADGYDPSKEENGDIQKSKVNAVRLMEEWCRRAPSDPAWQARFKVVPNAHNLTEIGMPNWIAKYNGKPFLIKRAGVTGFLFNHPELSCMEFDVSLHPFPYLAKQAICFMKENYFKKILVSFGFVIEGRADHELPECLIGLMQLCYPDPQYAIQAADFFAGTAKRSVDEH